MEGCRWLQFLFTAVMTLKTPGLRSLYLQRGGLLFGCRVCLLHPGPGQVRQRAARAAEWTMCSSVCGGGWQTEEYHLPERSYTGRRSGWSNTAVGVTQRPF
ncbi:unnamed protein product [Arctogadus glacialis]